MFKNILITAGTKVIQAVFAILILIVNAKTLGTEGVGVISLIILSITIIILLNNFVGGPALIYLIPRSNPASLFIISYMWAIIAVILGNVCLFFLKLIPEGFTIHVLLLSTIFSLHTVNLNFILAYEKIPFYNIITLMQMAILFVLLIIFYYLYQLHDIIYYVTGLYCSYSFAFITSLIAVFSAKRIRFSLFSKNDILILFKYGTWAQSTNLFQLLNQRLSYYLLETFTNKSILGIFSAGTQLSEGVLLLSNGAAMVQYARVSNCKDKSYNEKITLILIKFSVLAAAALIFVLLIVPEITFVWLLSAAFAQVHQVILFLAPGIIALAASLILSHFFSGTGKLKINFFASGIGLVSTIISGYLLIPEYGLLGACFTFSLSCLILVLFQFFQFFKISNCKISQLLISKSDINFVKQLFKEKFIK